MRRIKGYSPTYGNKYIYVSDEDYERVSKHHWTIEKGANTYYAMRKANEKKIRLHNFILNPEPPLVVDHINHNGLDNRRENMRIVTKRQNEANRRKTAGRKGRYKGVFFDTRLRKWVAYVNAEGRRKYLGKWKTAREAAIAFNEAALKYYGPTAWLNKIVDKR